MQHRVFVYGTLMRGEANHHYLRHARFLGDHRTDAGWRLFSLGSYPVLCPEGGQQVSGEVWQVSERDLLRLDELEECPRYYQRRMMATRFGPAWVYFQSRPPTGAHPIPGGDWRRDGRRHRFRFTGCPDADA